VGVDVQLLVRVLLLVVVAVGAQACSFRFLESYDESIESGISDYHKSTIDYLTRITQNAAAPENSYTSPASQTYYATSAAKLSDLVVKARTNSGPTCLPDQQSLLNPFIQRAIAQTPSDPKLNILQADVSLSAGTCTTVAVLVMKANHQRMQNMHQRRSQMGKSNAQLWSDLMEDSTRVALLIVKATKP
jgi:hypothetical protein